MYICGYLGIGPKKNSKNIAIDMNRELHISQHYGDAIIFIESKTKHDLPVVSTHNVRRVVL